MEKFTVNGNTYHVPDLDFTYLVMLDKNDIKLSNITGLAALNCFVAFCGNITESEAAKEISAHIINGGTITEVSEAYNKAVTESAFFRALLEEDENQTEMVEETTEKTSAKKSSKAVSE